jgi:diaminopimelate decarboxylase
VDQTQSDLIHGKLKDQFLGLWAKMYSEGVALETAKRAMASALLKTGDHLHETKDAYNSKPLDDLIEEVSVVLENYQKDGMNNALISAGLEWMVCYILGTHSAKELEAASK